MSPNRCSLNWQKHFAQILSHGVHFCDLVVCISLYEIYCLRPRMCNSFHQYSWRNCPHCMASQCYSNSVCDVTIQYIPRNMHTVFALLCFVVVILWLIFPYPSGLLHWHCGNLTIAPVPAKQPWWIWINTSCEFIMNDCITTTKQSTTKPRAYFLGYTVWHTPEGFYIWRSAWWYKLHKILCL